ncbi:hypothetical protein CDL15_Pgr017320 [Punica granatum]|uniref:Uncharacterized protein n=1 Tax=Punica granatum TaxID=22663 RepID=A0A218Y4E6_PUNGR|nr:hypothetical protein CDL15_Pgr017320 [Punica granatum]PKI79347.1 hypothetical protein CRG98_000292 [Punica granatum]
MASRNDYWRAGSLRGYWARHGATLRRRGAQQSEREGRQRIGRMEGRGDRERENGASRSIVTIVAIVVTADG